MGQSCDCSSGVQQDADNQRALLPNRPEDETNSEIDIEEYEDAIEEAKTEDNGDPGIDIPPMGKKEEDDGLHQEEVKEEEQQEPGPYNLLTEISDSPTLNGAETFWASKDASNINNLITKMRQGEIKKGLVNLLCSRSHSQRQQIRQQYQEKFTTDLMIDISNTIKKGKTRTLLEKLLRSPAELMADQLSQAMVNQSTKDVALIIVVLTNTQIRELSDAYAAQQGEGAVLRDDVMAFCKDDHMKTLLGNLLDGDLRQELPAEEVDQSKAYDDSETIKTALEKPRVNEIEVGVIVDILSTSSWHHIGAVVEKYHTLSDFGFVEAMEKKNLISLDVGFACHALVRVATDRYGYYAEQLSETDSWRGVDQDKVAEIVMYRCEIDLGNIMQTFSESNGYGSNLEFRVWLEKRISGTFHHAVSLLCGLVEAQGDFFDTIEPGAPGSPSGSDDPTGGGVPSMKDICTYSDFASFCAKKIGEKARLSLWKKVDRNEDGEVDAVELESLLNYTAVVYYTHKLKKEYGVKDLDDRMRGEAPHFVKPIADWILEAKLSDGEVKLTQDNFVDNEVNWIREFASIRESP